MYQQKNEATLTLISTSQLNNDNKNQFKNRQRNEIDTPPRQKKRHPNSQWAHEKVLSITNYQGNADQNQNEMSFLTCANGNRQEDKR